jgi:hypothetical protein
VAATRQFFAPNLFGTPDGASFRRFLFLVCYARIIFVKTRIDIPDKVGLRLKKKSRQAGTTVNDPIVRSINARLTGGAKFQSKRRPPVIESEKPGSLRLDNAKIFELIDFP